MKRILVVDDLEANRYLLEVTLQAYGYQVILATDGADALERARRHPPDLVISDILMPVMDGFALCKQWREDPGLRAIPFIFYTATYTDPKDEQLALDLGADRFVIKAQEPQVMIEIIRDVLAQVGKSAWRGGAQTLPHETVTLREYNEALVRKLEQKLMELEATRAELEEDIRQRKAAEASLGESERKYRQVVETLQEGIWVIDQAAITTFVNPHMAAMLDYTVEEMLGKHLFFFMDERGVEICKLNLERRRQGVKERHEFELLSKRGKLVTTTMETAPIFDDQGHYTGAIAAVVDITQRKQSEALADGQKQVLEMIAMRAPLPETLEKLLRVIEAQAEDMVCSILLLDADGAHLRHAAAPSLPRAYTMAIDGVAIGPCVGSCGTAAFTRSAVIVEDIADDPLWENYRAVALPHGLRACWSTPIFDARNQLLGTFAIYYRQPARPSAHHERLIDVATHNAAIAISRQRAAAALLESEERFRTIVEASPIGIFLTTPDGDVTYSNQADRRMTGLSPEDALSARWMKAIHPEDRERTLADWRAAMCGNREYAGTGRYLHADGAIVWWELRTVTIRVGDKLLGQVGMAVDITESRKLEERTRQIQKMEAIGQLAGGVAHDFNNILTIIQGSVSLLKLDGELSPEARDSTLEIEHAAERAAHLTRQLLTFSRRQTMQHRDVDLNKLVSQMTDMLGRILGEDIVIQVHLAPQPLFIHADSGMMDQILLNLAVNSRDAMPDGGRLIIETSAVTFGTGEAPSSPNVRSGSFACLSARDTGCGIAPEILPHIFEPFFTTKDVGQGTGLGLATVHGIVQQHQGWITVESDVGQGTTFRIYLPRLARVAEPIVVQTGLKTAPGGTETVLLVEDEQALRMLIQNVLVRLGYRVLEAPTGVAALEVWKQRTGTIHLLLTDLVMPDGLDGLELAERLLKEDRNLRVIYMSGYSADIAGRDFPMEEGVNFLAKPFRPHQLAKAVRECLDAPDPPQPQNPDSPAATL